jgi:hypothetical protein
MAPSPPRVQPSPLFDQWVSIGRYSSSAAGGEYVEGFDAMAFVR